MVFLLELCNKEPLTHLCGQVLVTRMHRLPGNMFLLILEQDQINNQTKKTLGPTLPFLYLKDFVTFTQILQKQPT